MLENDVDLDSDAAEEEKDELSTLISMISMMANEN